MFLAEALTLMELSAIPDKPTLDTQFRRRALKIHPDKGGQTGEFLMLNDARELISRHISMLPLTLRLNELLKPKPRLYCPKKILRVKFFDDAIGQIISLNIDTSIFEVRTREEVRRAPFEEFVQLVRIKSRSGDKLGRVEKREVDFICTTDGIARLDDAVIPRETFVQVNSKPFVVSDFDDGAYVLLCPSDNSYLHVPAAHVNF